MFFSVHTCMRIGSKIYRPCICYTYSRDLEPTINKLVAEGKATVYSEYVGFMNGKVLTYTKRTKKKE